MKYPANWFYTDRSPQEGTTGNYNRMPYEFDIYFGDEKGGVPPSRGGRGFINIKILNVNIAEFNANKEVQNLVFYSKSKTQTDIGGLSALKLEYQVRIPGSVPSSAFQAEELQFEYNKKVFLIDFENSEKTTLLEQIYSNFTSTFKFIN